MQSVHIQRPSMLIISRCRAPPVSLRGSGVPHDCLLHLSYRPLADGWVQIDVEGEYVGGEDEGNDPLEHSAEVVVAREGSGDEDDSKHDREHNEDELDPEGRADIVVLWVSYTRFRVSAFLAFALYCLPEGSPEGEEGETHGCPAAGTPSR